MTELQTVFDFFVCFGWILAYTLVFIGSKKYKFPLISVSAQTAIASFEIAVTIDCITSDATFNYAYIAYAYWAIIQISILVLSFKQRGFDIKKIQRCTLILVATTIVMYMILKIPNSMIYFANINTITGYFFWFYYIFDKNYPIKFFSVAAFVSKFVADILSVPVYFGLYGTVISVLNVSIPCLDFLFIILWIYRYYNADKYNVFFEKYEKYLPKIELYVPEKKKSAYGKMNKKKTRKN